MPLPADVLENARTLRALQTDAEELLWLILRNRRFCGIKFRRQHPIGRYIVDFYCHDASLAIELDGGGHAEPGQAIYDDQRSKFLEKAGVKVLRFWNNDVLANTEGVLEVIYGAVCFGPGGLSAAASPLIRPAATFSRREKG